MCTEQPDVEEIRAPQTPRPAAAPVAEANRTPTPRLPPFTFPEPTPEPQPDFTLVGISELSAGLGLPSVKADASGDASTTASHESRAHPGALYGKLIGWALEKPLTAKGLADFLQKQDTATPTKPPALSSVTPTKTVPQTTETTPKKSPPRLAKPKDTSTPRCVAAPAPNETITTPKGPSAQHQHRRSSVSTTSHHLHSRMPSHRRFPRRASRTKRMDQGPMPSSADIYPDDAHPPLPTHEHAHPCYPPATPIIANPFNWPPPAQAYAPEPPPSLADMHAADTDVLALIHEMPQPSLCTLVRLGNSHDLRATGAVGSRHALDGDARALSPAQRDGSRYGIRFWGIGYGDSWEVGVAGTFEQSEQFRVRPREHEGWGGRQWARVRGWGA
ncbi:uncharacterized protein M421DRAFT_175659 [Didymella exigua CBS 183.55]|uniref:Uncharacterized protein n=1 Tax=Didymella exigua CBS 183.55 TaxID=1150837 RepID=A0A6A5RN81_9PLEO|nr:uncharacterized protein M421DRAFT_175659 [Didymella exigua CBS 183.55]KAF1927796.1 hypothetical protein M421DRAFT_175659 [Didymella exigua CBS 183.55]